MAKQPLYPHKTPSEMEKEKRYTTVHTRYLIDCSFCGHLTEEMTFAAALKEAQRQKLRHNTTDENITVFDLMAKVGTCDTWDPDGKCLHDKHSEAWEKGDRDLEQSIVLNKILAELGFKDKESFRRYMKPRARLNEYGAVCYTEKRQGYTLNYSDNCDPKPGAYGIGGNVKGTFRDFRFN